MEIDEETIEHQQRRLGDFEVQHPCSSLQWFFIIAFAVLAGELMHTGIIAAITEYQIRMALAEAEANAAQMRRDSERAAAEARLRAENLKKQNLLEQRKQETERAIRLDQEENARRIAVGTCDFWAAQVRQHNSESNRTMRDAACSKVQR